MSEKWATSGSSCWMEHSWPQLCPGVPTDTFNLEDVSDKPYSGYASNPFLGFVSHMVIFFQEFRVGERSGRKLFIIENHQRRAPAICAWHLWDSFELEARGFSVHDVAEFLETDLGKRKLTYEGVTMSLVILWHPLPHDFFFFPKEKKNAEAVSRSWDSVRNILGQSKVLPDSGSPPLWVITWFSLYSFQCTLSSSSFFPLIHAN